MALMHEAVGTVEIVLGVDAERIASVEVRSSRPVTAVQALVGKTPAQALPLLGQLFAVCGAAHASAAVQALEAASGQCATAAQRHVRAALCTLEVASNHAWHVLVDLAQLLGEPPAARALASVRQEARRAQVAVMGGSGWSPDTRWRVDHRTLHASLHSLAEHLRSSVLGAPLPCSVSQLDQWASAGHTVAMRALGMLMRSSLHALGTDAVAPLPCLEAAWFGAQLSASPEFARAPSVEGRAVDPSVALQVQGTALLREVEITWGRKLLYRLLSRLVTLEALAELLPRLAELPEQVPVLELPEGASGSGAGMAETARGPVAHWLSLEEGRISAWRYVAPTEWLLHPEGVLCRGLRGLDTARAAWAPWWVTLVDPCAPTRLLFREVARA